MVAGTRKFGPQVVYGNEEQSVLLIEFSEPHAYPLRHTARPADFEQFDGRLPARTKMRAAIAGLRIPDTGRDMIELRSALSRDQSDPRLRKPMRELADHQEAACQRDGDGGECADHLS